MFTSSGDPLVGGEVLVAISQKLCKLQDQQHQKLELNEDGMSIKYAKHFTKIKYNLIITTSKCGLSR